MKTTLKNIMRTGFLFVLIATCSTALAQSRYITIKGQLKDAGTGEKIPYATITVPNTGIGTVSNSEGKFTLKVKTSLNAEFFEVSHLSYATKRFSITESTGKDQVFTLDLKPIQLQEISIVPKDAREIVEEALNNIRKNYSQVPNMMTGFYRESIRQRRDYLSISEAVVDIYKAPYMSMQNDQVKIFKGRKGSNVRKADTLMVQLQGGPNVAMLLDIVKNTDLSIALNDLDNYNFSISSMANIDNKVNWVISFTPAVEKEEPLYIGKLYISQENMAITRAEFGLDLTDENKASRMFVQKKPIGLLFLPTATSYLVNYKEQNGRLYLSYVRVELRFTCDWQRRLFKNNYTVISELAITDRTEDNVTKFPGEDQFRQNMIFSEKVQDLQDHDFWGDNNIIEPEQSIENAIRKISKSMQK